MSQTAKKIRPLSNFWLDAHISLVANTAFSHPCCFTTLGHLIVVVIFISAASLALQRCGEMKSCSLPSVARGECWKCQYKKPAGESQLNEQKPLWVWSTIYKKVGRVCLSCNNPSHTHTCMLRCFILPSPKQEIWKQVSWKSSQVYTHAHSIPLSHRKL